MRAPNREWHPSILPSLPRGGGRKGPGTVAPSHEMRAKLHAVATEAKETQLEDDPAGMISLQRTSALLRLSASNQCNGSLSRQLLERERLLQV